MEQKIEFSIAKSGFGLAKRNATFVDRHQGPRKFKSVAKCRGSWVVGRGRGSWVWVWVWVNVVGKKSIEKK